MFTFCSPKFCRSTSQTRLRRFYWAIFALYSVFCLLNLTGCGSKADEEAIGPQKPTAANSPYYSKCKIKDFTCFGNTANVTLAVPDHKGAYSYQMLLAMKVNNDPYQDLAVGITLTKFPSIGKFSLTTANADVSYYQRPFGDQYESTKVRGTLEITEYQPKKIIAGKFALYSEDGTNSLEIKEGEFKIEADF